MQNLLSMIHGLGAMAMITIGYGWIQRFAWPKWKRHLFLGVLFGMGASFAMLEPMVIAPGVLMDTRNLFIAFAGAFLGPIGAATALCVGGATRLALGGVGAPLGVFSMSMAAMIGVMWTVRALRPRVMELHHFALMGVHVSLALVSVAFLPVDQMNRVIADVLPFLLCFNVVGATAFGTLLERERGLARRERSLLESADRDFLTKALNRRGFDHLYADARQTPAAAGSALLLIDFDRFKAINDTHGHGVGDEVLVAATRAMSAALRSGDLLARMGGEEFAVFLSGVGEYEAYRQAEVLRRAIQKEVRIPSVPDLRVTASVGGAYFPAEVPPLSDGLREADSGLYAAKERGRDRTVMQSMGQLAAA